MIEIANFQWNPETQRLLADGAWGTSLMQRGLERHDLADRTTELNRKAAEIAKAAALESKGQAFSRPLVAGSIGPSGKMLMMDEICANELFSVFVEQVEALRDGSVDCILVESMIDLEEMTLAVRAAREKTDLPIIASMTYEKGNQGYRTIMGNDSKACVDRALEEGASVVGANCGTGIANYVDLAKELCAMKAAPVWIKANAGLPEIICGDTVYKQTPDEYVSFMPELLDAGVNVIGGCCGTTPDFIKAMRRELDSWLHNHLNG